MLTIIAKLDDHAPAGDTLTLDFGNRRRTRQRVHLDSGHEAALLLPRGTVLRDGDRVQADGGLVIEVRAAPELVSTARCADPLRLARACYHLGNRHVPVQVGTDWVRYLHDHVLDAMLVRLGLEVSAERVPFEPESGAYGGGHHHHHGHAHGHDDGDGAGRSQ